MSIKSAACWSCLVILITGPASTFADPAKVVVIPMFGDDAPSFKTIFVTKSSVTGDMKDESKGDFTGPRGADRVCQEEADAPGSKVQGKSFKAWLGGRFLAIGFGSDESDRRFRRYDLPYQLTDGTKVANNYADLTDGSISASINRQADGAIAQGINSAVWTGANAFGDFFDPLSTCTSWTNSSNSHPAGVIGRYNSKTFSWSASSDRSLCGFPRRLYCIEQ